MKNDDFAKQVTAKLDQLAQNHRNKAVVMDQVLETIHKKPFSSHFMTWKMTGFALAAAITGFVVLPTAVNFNDKPNTEQVVIIPKLSPQMMEDLEMLSVFGEETVTHGS